MPEETSTNLFLIQVEGKEAIAALEQLQAAFQRIEQAVTGMGEKFDAAINKMVEPITRLTTSVDALNASIVASARLP